MKVSENPKVPRAPMSSPTLRGKAVASFVFGSVTPVTSSASVINDNLKGVTRAEK